MRVVVVQEIARREGARRQVAPRQDAWGQGAREVARVEGVPDSFLLHGRPEVIKDTPGRRVCGG